MGIGLGASVSRAHQPSSPPGLPVTEVRHADDPATAGCRAQRLSAVGGQQDLGGTTVKKPTDRVGIATRACEANAVKRTGPHGTRCRYTSQPDSHGGRARLGCNSKRPVAMRRLRRALRPVDGTDGRAAHRGRH